MVSQTPVPGRARNAISSPPHQSVSLFFFFSFFPLNHLSLLGLGNLHYFPRILPIPSQCLLSYLSMSLQIWAAALVSFAGWQNPSSFVSENRWSAMSLWYLKECFFSINVNTINANNGQRWEKHIEDWAPDSTGCGCVSSCPWLLKNSFPSSLWQSMYCGMDRSS